MRTFHRGGGGGGGGGGLVFVVGDHGNFPSWIMMRNPSHWVRDLLSLSLTD